MGTSWSRQRWLGVVAWIAHLDDRAASQHDMISCVRSIKRLVGIVCDHKDTVLLPPRGFVEETNVAAYAGLRKPIAQGMLEFQPAASERFHSHKLQISSHQPLTLFFAHLRYYSYSTISQLFSSTLCSSVLRLTSLPKSPTFYPNEKLALFYANLLELSINS